MDLNIMDFGWSPTATVLRGAWYNTGTARVSYWRQSHDLQKQGRGWSFRSWNMHGATVREQALLFMRSGVPKEEQEVLSGRPPCWEGSCSVREYMIVLAGHAR